MINKVRINAVTIRVSMLVEGRRVQAVIDSGPEVSVWSSKDYYSLPDSDRPPLLQPTIELVVADHEQKLAAEGVAMTKIQIDELEFQWPMYVASIPESLLLGLDILDAQDLVVSSRKGLMVRNTWVACEVTRHPVRVQQVVIVNPKPLVVPPEHEMIVQVPLEPDQLQGCQDAVLEPLVEDKRGLLLARSLINKENKWLPIRMVNLSQHSIKLPRGHPLGELHPVDQQVQVLSPTSTVRQVKVETLYESESGNVAGEAEESSNFPTEEDVRKKPSKSQNISSLSTSTLQWESVFHLHAIF